VISGAGLTDSERFDIDAKTDGPCGADPMLQMLQTLLQDGFQLRFHREMKKGPVSVLELHGAK
jgi:uncharacterized protein (TIGR03435 family)